MLAIKKQEQAAYEALVNDPVKRRLLLKAGGVDLKPKEHRRRKHRRDDQDTHRSSRKRHRPEEDDRHRRGKHGHRRRSQSISSTSSQSPYRRRTPSPLPRRARSPSPYRRRRSPVPARDRSLSPYRRRSPSPYRSQRRSPSPYQNRRSPLSPQERSPPPYAQGRPPSQHSYRDASTYHRSRSPRIGRNGDSRLKHSKSWHNIQRRNTSPHKSGLALTDRKASDREARIAAMQDAACELDQTRAKRLAALEERERLEQEVDDAARAKSSKYGGKGDFIAGLHRTAGELDVGERMRRGRHGLERNMDD